MLTGLLFCASPADAVKSEPGRHEFRKLLMGVECRLVLHAADAEAALRAARAAFDEIERLDAILSDWRPDSELSRLVARAGQGFVPVSDELFEVLALAQQVAERSDGAFDVTIGPLSRLWREARRAGRLPGAEEAARAAALVGWRGLRLGLLGGPHAALERPGMALDPGAIGKGYACDRALAVLAAAGVDRALIELGGDLVASGAPPGQDGWLVQVGCEEPLRRLRLAHGAVAVSGDSRQFLEVDGVRYSHALDPRDGAPLTQRICCTVRAPSGALAEALAAAATVLGPAQGARLVRGTPGAELLVDRPGLLAARPGSRRAAWRDLLAGEGLPAWEAVDAGGAPRAPDDYPLSDGVLSIPSAEPGGHLQTRDDFCDLHLRLDFALASMANGGLFLRAARDGSNPAFSGCEIQLLDDWNWEERSGTTLQPWQFTGSLYGAVAPSVPDALAPIGAWNTLEVLLQGRRLAVALNGQLLYDVDTHAVPAEPPFAARAASGFLGLQRYASPLTGEAAALRIRNLFVQELDS